MSYIYEMDVAQLRISYIVPEGLHCFKIQTTLLNWAPYDRSEISMKYEAHICGPDMNDNNNFFQCFESESLQALTEKVRRYFIKHPYKQSPVEKSPEDGTDSLIST